MMRFRLSMSLLAVVLVLGLLTAGSSMAEEAVAGRETLEAGRGLAVNNGCGQVPENASLLASILTPEAPEVPVAGEADATGLEAPEGLDPTLDWTNQACTPGIVCYSISDCYPGRCHVDLWAGTHLCVCP